MADTPKSGTTTPAPRRSGILRGALPLAVLLLAAGACRSLLPVRVPAAPDVRFQEGLPADVPTRTVGAPDGAGLTLVRGMIAGRDSGWLLLDSGSANLLVSRRVARELKLPVAGEGYAGRDLRVTYHLAESFQLGPLVLEKALVAAADWNQLATLRQALGVDLAGFAGYQVFAHAVVEIQYGAGGPPDGGDRVLLHDPRAYQLPRGSWLPLRIIDRRPTVIAYVTLREDGQGDLSGPADRPTRENEPNGQADEAFDEAAPPSTLRALFMVDTGTAGGLILDGRFAHEAGLALDPASAATEQITLTDPVRVGTTRVPRLAFGERTFDDLPATVRPDLFRGRGALAAVDGMIGRQLLEGHTVVFDLPHQRMALLDPER